MVADATSAGSLRLSRVCGHLANDKRADIIGILAGMRLPVEIKGQWHTDAWTAADTQLDRRYTRDYAAERRGISLVLWFGRQVPKTMY